MDAERVDELWDQTTMSVVAPSAFLQEALTAVREAEAKLERHEANWADLADRAEIAEANLDQMASQHQDDAERARLKGKASGVALVRDYMRGYHS